MKPCVAIYLSDGIAARLAVATQRPGVTKSALIEAALDRFLNRGDDLDGHSVVRRRLNEIGRQLEQLEHDLRIVSEIVALQARFHLAVAPPLPDMDRRAACALGSERFDEFAAQVARRVRLRTSLIKETIERGGVARQAAAGSGDRQSRTRAEIPQPTFGANTLASDVPERSTFDRARGNRATGAKAEQTYARSPPRPARQAATRQAEDDLPNWLKILRVFVPFVAAYFLSFLFRTINATIAEPLKSEFGFGAGDLGLLTSVYFLTFAIAQIPIAVFLDRYGPRQVQSAVLMVAAIGAGLFAVSDDFWLLVVGRALIGVGVAAALTAGLKAIVIWFPSERVALLNGVMIMMAALGGVAATEPADYLLGLAGWRQLFELLAIASAICALAIFLVVPKTAPLPREVSGARGVGLRTVYTDLRFWRFAPLSASCIGTAWALQGLWAVQWFSDVERLDRSGSLRNLLVMAIASSIGALVLGIAAHKLGRRGMGARALFGFVAIVFFAAQLGLILRVSMPSIALWGVVAVLSAATVLSYAVLADYFPRELTGRANAALNVFHIGCAFVMQFVTGLVVQYWIPQQGHYPAIAYQTAFAINLAAQIAAWLWFVIPLPLRRKTGARPGS
jgi:MFS family permease